MADAPVWRDRHGSFSELEVLLLQQEERLKQHFDHALQRLVHQLTGHRSAENAAEEPGIHLRSETFGAFELQECIVPDEQVSTSMTIPIPTVAKAASPSDVLTSTAAAEDQTATVASSAALTVAAVDSPNQDPDTPERKESSVKMVRSLQNYLSRRADTTLTAKLPKPQQDVLQRRAARSAKDMIMVFSEARPGVRELIMYESRSSCFDLDLVVVIMIAANVVLIGVELQTTSYLGREPFWALPVNIGFCVVFALDLLCRVAIQRTNFFFGDHRWWNFLDALVVLGMLADLVLPLPSDLPRRISILRLLRLLRILRVIRLVKLAIRFKFFREVGMLIKSITEPVRSMVWIMCIDVCLIYAMSLVLSEAAMQRCLSDPRGGNPLCEYFGTVSASMMSLFQATFFGILWGELYNSLAGIHWFYSVIFVAFMTFSIVIVANTTASFLFRLQKQAFEQERTSNIQNEIEASEAFLQQMIEVFQEFDLNSNGAISWAEFELALDDTRMNAFLATVDLRVHDAKKLFDILDTDCTGAVEIDEFVFGCWRLKGGAKSTDIVKIEMELEHVKPVLLENRNLLRAVGEKLGVEMAAVRSLLQDSRSAQEGSKTGPALARLGSNSSFLTLDSRASRTDLRVEDRAVTLRDLARIASAVNGGCKQDHWTDQRTGETLLASNVNLYHFNYHHILPSTAPKGITLRLPFRTPLPRKGAPVHQPLDDGSVVNGTVSTAEVIIDAEQGTQQLKVQVHLMQGRFKTDSRASSVRISGEDYGMPLKVSCEVTFSYKELMSPEAQPALWFCSHWWGEPILDFVSCCKHHSELKASKQADSSYWVCAYANRQHDIEADLGSDVLESSFFKAMVQTKGIVLILEESGKALSRIWCDFELYLAVMHEKDFDVVTISASQRSPAMLSKHFLPHESAVAKSRREMKFPVSLLLHGLQVRLETGEASVADDKVRILQTIAGKVDLNAAEGQEVLKEKIWLANSKLHSTMAILAWPQAMSRGMLLNFGHEVSNQPAKLPEILRADSTMKHLQLSLAHFAQACGDEAIKILAGGLPPNLEKLTLSFEGCSRITDWGVQSLARNLSDQLEELYLDFLGCTQVTDTGLQSLASGLPRSLRVLELHFAGCQAIGAFGIRMLRDSIPPGLTRFKASFRGTGADVNFEDLGQLRRF
eukprot:TRINITY_DN6998_c0_g3_i1.p1 TRINITY_DN6998_c0_g3~~TRINITY_DN6998_c0_g3_i1.p1  ORF type:complete len:1165 (+),score=209.90 TRINITY_DN6998_c0_g3_i1:78-3572(+)